MWNRTRITRALGAVVGVALCAGPIALGQSGVLYEIEEASPFLRFGQSVAPAGDVNLDGVGDLLIGSSGYNPMAQTYPPGAVGVYSGADGTQLSLIQGPAKSSFGWAMRPVGDVDFDGTIDFIASGWGNGVVRVHSTRSSAVLYEFTASPASAFGWSVDSAGDVDADGFVDFVVGAYGTEVMGIGLGVGSAYVWSGRNGALLHRYQGQSSHEFFGWSVAGLSDINLDGFDEFGIGASNYKSAIGPGVGVARVYSGKDGAVIREFFGEEPKAGLGTDMSRAGDVDGDGFEDFLIVGYGGINTAPNQVQTRSGSTGRLLGLIKVAGPGVRKPVRAGPFTDFDGDGRDEILVTFEDPNEPAATANAVAVYDPIANVELFTVEGDFWDKFGLPASHVGDVNGDGRLDLAVGSWAANKVTLFSPTCGSIETYGTNCPVPSGFGPKLFVEGCATPGGELEFFSFSGGAQPSVAAIVAAVNQVLPPPGAVCPLLVAPPWSVTLVPTNPYGTLDAFAVDTPLTMGTGTIYLQVLYSFQSSPTGWVATDGRAIHFE